MGINYKQLIIEDIVNFYGNIGVYFDDLKGNAIALCDEQEFNGCSCIKLYILIALFRKMKEENISEDTYLKYKKDHYVDGSGVIQFLTTGLKLSLVDTATLMMIISDNIATNMLIDYLTIPYINDVIKEIGCEKTKLISRFRCVEDEPFSIITPKDYDLAWKKLYQNELFDIETTNKIINIIKNGQYHEMVGNGIDIIYKQSSNPLINYIATKSGKYMYTRCDGGIVSTVFGDYICTIFIHSTKDYNYMNDDYIYSEGKKISRLLFEYYLSLYSGLPISMIKALK